MTLGEREIQGSTPGQVKKEQMLFLFGFGPLFMKHPTDYGYQYIEGIGLSCLILSEIV